MPTATSAWFGGHRTPIVGCAADTFGGSTGGPSTFCTWTTTMSVAVPPWPSSTASSKARSSPPAPTSGAVKLVIAEKRSSSVTPVPPTWLQAYVSASPSASLPLPPSVTTVLSTTVWSAPATATGALLTSVISTVTRSRTSSKS